MVLSIFKKTRYSFIAVQYASLDGLLALILKRLFRVKIVLFTIGSDVLKVGDHSFAYPLIRTVITNSDLIFCVSSTMEKLLLKIGADISKINVIPSVIHIDDFEYYNGHKKYEIITVGSLDENKNHRLLLDACKMLPRSTRVLIIGQGPLDSYLKSKSVAHRINASFLGRLSHKEVFTEMQKSMIYVHTSKSEGMPVAVLEAIFSGLPIVLVERPYIYDIIYRYGLKVHVVDGNSTEDLADKINRVLENYETERDIASSNKQKLTKLIDKLPKQINEALSKL